MMIKYDSILVGFLIFRSFLFNFLTPYRRGSSSIHTVFQEILNPSFMIFDKLF